MIEIQPSRLPALAPWFPAGAPGVAALAEHVLTTGNGRWWADRSLAPRVLAVESGDHVLLRGAPQALPPAALGPLASHYVQAPAGFVPLLRTAFARLDPWERMVYLRAAPALPAQPPRGTSVRRLTIEDAPALAALGPGAGWIHSTWGGPHGLAGSGAAWGAFRRGQLLAVACTYLLGSRYEDVAVLAAPGHRRQHLALACVTALCEDIAARGRTPSWSCSRDNRPSRLLAWRAGFRLHREYVHYATGGVRLEDSDGRAA
ncbi:GNAT family N-acetyltransferase [Streptomyces sp. NBC_00091]|uniref:GNAT family N-acetyltransferase n=1 Tax=Streptomyces sp. NBC_00091 TaxID=2975648 RepID=UPI00225C13CC|nr:GNAT family N-acetyltransferase [Streptomyces sp. NBC_00091]MCX5380831.1 GNAT family N-acetyltransferase [Streptomyces sp. NBC_00091]